MVNITLFELHLDDSNLTTNTPFSGRKKEVEAAGEPPGSESSSKGKLVGALVGVVFLAAVAFVVRKKVIGGGSDPEGEEFEVADVKA